jgi:V8-like Glu-specific endopeptidase
VPACAITIADSNYNPVISPADPTFQGAAGGDAVNLSGVVQIISAGIGGCTGTLMANGTSILTAGHCVSSKYGGFVSSQIQVTFLGPNGNNAIYTASSVAVDPNWDGTASDGGDLAVIQLGALAPAYATEYQLDMEPAVYGAATVLAGYGYSGTGSNGFDNSTFSLTLRAGENDFIENGHQFYSGWNAGLLVGQFYENGVSSTNVLNSLNPFSASDEVDIAPGDSGGPGFQDVNGTEEIVGVNDLISCDTANCTPNSSFGQIYADTSVYANLSWIEAETTSVPEPRTLSLMLGALLLSMLLRPLRSYSMSARAEIARPQKRTLRRASRG